LVELEYLTKLKRLLDNDYKIEKIQPPVFASDAEINIVTVTLLCPDGKKETICYVIAVCPNTFRIFYSLIVVSCLSYLCIP